jgi:hypothetical protein
MLIRSVNEIVKWIINRSDTTMEELDIFEFDPLSSQSAGSYVKSVMQSMVGNVIIEADYRCRCIVEVRYN